MEDLDDFFFNATLTVHSATHLHGFDPAKGDSYEPILGHLLDKAISEDDTDERLTGITWETDSASAARSWASDELRGKTAIHDVSRSFIFIQGRAILHRVCIVTWSQHPGALVFTNCSPRVVLYVLDWIRKSFDSVVSILNIPDRFVRYEYEKFVRRRAARRVAVGVSQIIFIPPKVSPELKRLTIAINSEDMLAMYNESVTERAPVLTRLQDYIAHYSAIDLSKCALDRINCANFVCTTNGRLKLFQRTVPVAHAREFVCGLAEACHQYLTSLEGPT